jgi:hypothetical protein
MKNRALAFGILMAISLVAFSADDSSLDQQIERLIVSIGNSECVFIRNGKDHTAEEGMRHISRKYDHYRDDIDSVESFVKLTASKSMITGRVYQVRCDQAPLQTTAQWLLDRANTMGVRS